MVKFSFSSHSCFLGLLKSGFVLTLIVMLLGSWVRWSDAGLGCPDWPGCYGKIFGVPDLLAESSMPLADSGGGEFNKTEAVREVVHRYFAGFLGIVVILLNLMVWRNRRNYPLPVMGVTFLLLFLIGQMFLGMLTVTMKLQPVVVSGHLLGGLGILAFFWWLILTGRSNPRLHNDNSAKRKILARFVWVMVALLTLQVVSGGWTSSNYAALACHGFPTCNGEWWPKMNLAEAFYVPYSPDINYEFGVLGDYARIAIQITHRLGAVIFGISLLVCAFFIYFSRIPKTQTPAMLAALLLLLQIIVGAIVVSQHSNFPVPVAHAGISYLLLLTLLTLAYRLRSQPLPQI